MPAKTRGGVVTIMCVVAVLAVVSEWSTPLGAQWLNYPTAGVPRTAAGTPNLDAPAPRTVDGKPDLSGTWDVEHNRPCPAGRLRRPVHRP